MNVDYIALSVPVFFLLIALELAWALWKKQDLYSLPDAISNISCGIGQQLTGLFFKSFLFWGYYQLYTHFRLWSIEPSVLSWVALFVGVDFCYYWFHRFSHEINAIWATHIVHHQSEEYNLTVALRQSWFQSFFSNLFYLPLALVGFDPTTTLTVIAFNTLYQFWIHTELIRKMPRWFEWLFNTPSHHRVHHGSNPEYIDKNHGGTLIVWDRLFGTFAAEREPVVYGITTPLRSWNPLWANVHYWRDLFRLAMLAPSFGEGFKVFWAPPGWRPQSLGGPEYPRPVSRGAFHKFRLPIQPALAVYLALQFALVLALASFILFQAPFIPLARLLVPALWILLSITTIGLLAGYRKGRFIAEIIRLLLGAVLCVVLVPQPVFMLGGLAAMAVSILVLLRLHQRALLRIEKPENTPFQGT